MCSESVPISFPPDDTIAAVASPAGVGIRGIIRISGPNVGSVVASLLGKELPPFTEGHSKAPARIPVRIPVAQGRLHLDAHACCWPTHRSFTGEPLVELHLPGSLPLMNEILSHLFLSGARPAERGEFTLRAFLAGRIDLVQAEAVLGVIDAGNTTELQTALAQLAGGISGRMATVREELLLHLADLEAGLDFVEEDIEFVDRTELRRRLIHAQELIDSLRQQAAARMEAKSRFLVVLAGLPNAGKSTLFNRLAGRPAALVSPIPGTTRDYLTASITHRGMTFDLIDTAGWEPARDGIESLAAELRNDQIERADLLVWCTALDLTGPQIEENHSARQVAVAAHSQLLDVWTKSDRSGETSSSHAHHSCNSEEQNVSLRISSEQGTGLTELLDAIVGRLAIPEADTEMIASTAARCIESLEHAYRGVLYALQSLDAGAGDELIALELRDVLEHLGRIVGRVYTDDILDRIFSRFCIGK